MHSVLLKLNTMLFIHSTRGFQLRLSIYIRLWNGYTKSAYYLLIKSNLESLYLGIRSINKKTNIAILKFNDVAARDFVHNFNVYKTYSFPFKNRIINTLHNLFSKYYIFHIDRHCRSIQCCVCTRQKLQTIIFYMVYLIISLKNIVKISDADSITPVKRCVRYSYTTMDVHMVPARNLHIRILS